MVTNFEIGDWVRIKDEEDSYNIKSVDSDKGYIELRDIAGHTWFTPINTVTRKCTNEEIYGRTEETTADEYNADIYTEDVSELKNKDKDYGPPYGPHNPTGNEYSKFGDGEEE